MRAQGAGGDEHREAQKPWELAGESACPTRTQAVAHQSGTDAFVCQPSGFEHDRVEQERRHDPRSGQCQKPEQPDAAPGAAADAEQRQEGRAETHAERQYQPAEQQPRVDGGIAAGFSQKAPGAVGENQIGAALRVAQELFHQRGLPGLIERALAQVEARRWRKNVKDQQQQKDQRAGEVELAPPDDSIRHGSYRLISPLPLVDYNRAIAAGRSDAGQAVWYAPRGNLHRAATCRPQSMGKRDAGDYRRSGRAAAVLGAYG